MATGKFETESFLFGDSYGKEQNAIAQIQVLKSNYLDLDPIPINS